MRTTLLALAIMIAVLSTSFERGFASQDADAALRERARASLRKMVEFYRTKVATEGGTTSRTLRISATAVRR